MLLILSGCQDDETFKETNVDSEKSIAKMVNKNSILNLSSLRVFCPGQVVSSELKKEEHCKSTPIRQIFNIFNEDKKLIKVVETKVNENLMITLPEGKYTIKNSPAPLIQSKELSFTLIAGEEKKLDIELSVLIPINRPLVD